MNGNLIAIICSAFILGILISGFVGIHMQERYEHEFKMACINANKNLIDGNCIDGETK